jgi:addiction module HigA family antidote
MRAKKKYEFHPDYAIPPGETLRELMEMLQMTQKDLADRVGLTVQTLNRIFKGEQPITYETANKLELVTGTPARVWNNLEMQYREQLAKIKEKACLERDLNWLKTIPVNELRERGFIKEKSDKAIIIRELFSFYGVASVDAWKEIWDNPRVAARRSACFETQPGSASAWIRQGELQSQEISCQQFDKKHFAAALIKIRKLTKEKPEVLATEMKGICACAGVALALVKEMKKVPWNGATKWISPDKAMILLSIRGKGEDKFWFSFFHEAAHVINGSKRHLYIADNSNDPEEVKADIFAADFLIPREYNDRIMSCTSENEIIEIASELNISPGIVAGRYQFLTKRWSYFKNLIHKFEWTNS